MRLADGALSEYADMSSIATWHCNDMVLSADGRAYVGNFGYDHYNEPEEKPRIWCASTRTALCTLRRAAVSKR